MSTASLIASIVLGLVFLLAGASKLAAGERWPAQARELGAPAVAIPVLPWVELAIGAALVAQLVEPWPAVAALLLLLAFTIVLARQLVAGRTPDCACFGRWSASPVGPGHLIRNAVFLMIGMVALYG
jgi:uncharacterized membrane protein YphA (DoxX/SURF4 family)